MRDEPVKTDRLTLATRLASATLALWMAVLPAILRGDDTAAQHAEGVLTLANGNTVAGVLLESNDAETIRWQGKHFSGPFDFRTASVKSIKFPTRRGDEVGRGEFAFEFGSGDVISGNLEQWTKEVVAIRSPQFGMLRFRPGAIRRMHRIEQNATIVFASLAGLQDWTNTNWDTRDWVEDGNHLWTSQIGATLNGDLGVPDRAVVEFEISWSGRADFVFAIGVDPQRKVDTPTDGWRFESFGNELAVVREGQDSADVEVIGEFSNYKRIHLVAYLDQATGEMQVFTPEGEPAGSVGAGLTGLDNREAGSGIRLINRGQDLRLERLRIARWLGSVPTRADEGQASIAIADGSFLSGSITRYDSETGALVIGDPEQESSVNVDDVLAVKFAPGDTESVPSQCALFLHGGQRLSGDLESIDADNWTLEGEHFEQPVKISRTRVRSMIVFNNDASDALSGTVEGRPGRLELGEHTLNGRLVSAQGNDPPGNPSLHWLPFGSRVAAPLDPEVSGRIVYRDPPRVDTSTAAARALAMQRLRLQQQKRGLNFGKLFLERADNVKAGLKKKDAHVVHIRTGDVIACHVDEIDSRGVRLSTGESHQGFVPHARVKAIEFATNSSPPDIRDAKRERLLTLPRLQKNAPPSHLICSHNGDLLRCRVLELDDEMIRVEVQNSEMEIPRQRVAQLIWFHRDEMEDPSAESNSTMRTGIGEMEFTGMAQVLQRDGKRVTFKPTEVMDNTIVGVSDVIGECSFDVNEVDHLILGKRIEREIQDLAYNQWRLQSAIEPLVNQETGESMAMGSESQLIGQEAPEVKLDLLDGGQYRLTENRGKIVVLDFWATWCAPCMQTIPLMTEAMEEFDSEQVQLVSINLEESPDQIRDVLDRHKFDLTVALDIDGVAAQRYQARAIPQLVIVDPDGKINRLYVGGGPRVVEAMKAAVSELLE